MKSVEQSIIDLCSLIKQRDPSIKAFLPEPGRQDRLLKNMSELSEKYPDPAYRPVLYGLPVAVKDIYRVDGFETQCGSRLPPSLFSGTESSVISRLKAAGALILGKTVTTEFAWFQPGPTRNPHNTDHTPGGSSSGSAAAVAAGMAPVALGTQTIGSVIRPAAYCGIVGVKPSAHSMPTDGIIPFSPTFDQAGYFTHDIETAEAIAPVICDEWHTTDTSMAALPSPGITTSGLQKQHILTIGIPDTTFLEQADDHIANTFFNAMNVIKKAGHTLIHTNLFADIKRINREHKALVARDFAMVHAAWYSEFSHLYSQHSKKLIQEGREIADGEVSVIVSHRSAVQKDVALRMDSKRIDLWLSPAATSLPPKGLSSTGSPLMNLPWTFTGVPCITIPLNDIGLPLPAGLQCSGKMNELKKLFADVKTLSRTLRSA
jgi:Asp-tRNA(Asn)/Glu-tRNA(Gln) amidotransferase A subunit family amidase